jgi:hypothetical protein
VNIPGESLHCGDVAVELSRGFFYVFGFPGNNYHGNILIISMRNSPV